MTTVPSSSCQASPLPWRLRTRLVKRIGVGVGVGGGTCKGRFTGTVLALGGV